MPSAPTTVEPTAIRTPARATAFCFERTPVRPGTYPVPDDRLWVGQVRRITETRLRHWGLERLQDDVGLLISELVTNALLYGNAEAVHIRITRTRDGVRLAVRSGPVCSDEVRVNHAGPDEEHGRGLLLVATLTESWGVDEEGWVWCAVPVPTT
ncbi:ATP-binding protein [Streptomyces sp. NPDC002490]|uniref:ATP-binding protein n=1 Tax=Streptomyces sp. NPDC002490 TaxID=3154416 RepID=UPI003325D857